MATQIAPKVTPQVAPQVKLHVKPQTVPQVVPQVYNSAQVQIGKQIKNPDPVDYLESNIDIFNFDPAEIIDHEEVVTTSADELFNLLEQTEKEEMESQFQNEDTSYYNGFGYVADNSDQMYADDFEEREGTVYLEEIPDDGQIQFEEPKGDDQFFTADEIEHFLTPKRMDAKPSNYVSDEEYEMLEFDYPDLFKVPGMNEEIRSMMAAFILGRQDNPNPSAGQLLIIKISEAITMTDPKQITELYFEMNFQNGEWRRFHKIFTYAQDGVLRVVDYLDGSNNHSDIIHNDYPPLLCF
uniref:NOT2_3_5 domain-containing protein n=1 Tax=Caenorhabditis tropicalis TaxID=1561998 RepID=A0A1I7U0R5_9PELO